MTLPLIPVRHEGEGAVQFLLRLAEANGAGTLAEAAADLGLRRFDVAKEQGIGIIAAAAGCNAAGLRRDTAQPSPSTVALRGETLLRRHWSITKARRVCPACLAEDLAAPVPANRPLLPRAWQRTIWDVRPLTVCTVHRTRLIERCPTCDAALDYRHAAVARCAHGHRLDGSAGPTVEGPSAGDDYIAARLAGAGGLGFLDAAKLGDAVAAMQIAGQALASLGGCSASPPHRVLDAGFRALAGWPESFERLLDRVSAVSPSRPGRWGAAAAYGRLHERLAQLDPGGGFGTALRQSVEAHARRHGLVTDGKTVLGCRAGRRGEHRTLKDAGAMMGMSPTRARRYLGLNGLLPRATRRGTPVLIPRGRIGEVAQSLSGTVDQRRLSRRLGIGRAQTRTLVRAGTFAPVYRAGAAGLAAHAFRVSDIDGIVDRMARDAPLVEQAAVGHAALPDACRMARTSLEEACARLLSGALVATGRLAGRAGLAGIVVPVAELRRIGKAARGLVTLDDAASELGVKWETVRSLIRLGLLEEGRGGTSREALAAFRDGYVKGAEIARALGISPKELTVRARALGIEPAAAPPGCRQVFFRRRDLPRLHAPRGGDAAAPDRRLDGEDRATAS